MVTRLLDDDRAPLVPDDVGPGVEVDAGADTRLRRLAESCGLTDFDVEVLLIALAPDIDPRFEQFYGYLNDDVTRRRATVGLALALCGATPAVAAARARFTADAPLVACGLLTVEDDDRPLPARALRVPDRVVAHLLGDDNPDAALAEVLLVSRPGEWAGRDTVLHSAIRSRVPLVYLREQLGGGAVVAAVSAAAHVGIPTVVVDLRRVGDQLELVARALLETRLIDGVLIAVGMADAGRAVRQLADDLTPVVLVGVAMWDPAWAVGQPLLLDVAPPAASQRSQLWRAVLDGRLPAGLDAEAATMQYVLTPEQVGRAAESAWRNAELAGRPVDVEDLRRGARAQNSAGLERLARRVHPGVGWDDLVLPDITLEQLQEVSLRARQRGKVLDEWRMRPGGGRGRGVTALFAGDSGTGKTMSAEVVAADLGLDLYTVNLATVVDKYIGETEKNLERIFEAAAGVNAVLLFDEADALFGRRSEVRDAHDRYANIESAYLLQRMESFDGLAILSTNLRANLDEAFTRRLDVVINYTVPDAEMRRYLWQRSLGPHIPRADDLDLAFCADAFELSGGNIRSAVITAAYLAAGADRPLSMADLIAGVHREYRKLGRLTVASEFGKYHAQLR